MKPFGYYFAWGAIVFFALMWLIMGADKDAFLTTLAFFTLLAIVGGLLVGGFWVISWV